MERGEDQGRKQDHLSGETRYLRLSSEHVETGRGERNEEKTRDGASKQTISREKKNERKKEVTVTVVSLLRKQRDRSDEAVFVGRSDD